MKNKKKKYVNYVFITNSRFWGLCVYEKLCKLSGALKILQPALNAPGLAACQDLFKQILT